MSNVFSRVTRYAKDLVFPFGVLFSVFSGSLHATVTWDGDEGVSKQVFQAHCITCHSDTPSNGNPEQAPHWTSYTTTKDNIVNIVDRINRAEGDSLLMPPNGPPLSSGLVTLVEAWHAGDDNDINLIADNTPEKASPTVKSKSAESITKEDATLKGEVNANGLETTYVFEWGLKDGGLTDQTPPPLPETPDTNGGSVNDSFEETISSLTCGEEYQFRIGAKNSENPPDTFSYGDTLTFETAPCDLPVVLFGGSQVAGVGQTVTLPIELEGDGATDFKYPVDIQYQVSGTAAPGDFDLSSGTLSIASGTSENLTFNITGNSNAPADATVEVNLTAATNATVVDPSTYTVVIAGTNTAPTSPPLQVNQDGLNTQYVYKNKGNVTIRANDGAGQFSYDWSATAALLPGEASGNQYTFDPSAPSPGLTSGPYVVSVAIDDGQQTTHQTITLWVDEIAPSLSCDLPDDDADGNAICDELEGYGDFDFDGLPDYLDPIGDPSLLNREVSSTGDNHARLIMATAGLSLALNDTAVELVASGDATGAKLSADDVVDDSGFSAISSVFDFQIRGLSNLQRTAQVVIPLDNPMRPNARYRKLIDGIWSDFVETSTDGLRSAKSDEDNNECPPPGDPLYQIGLITFNDCLELTLTDGGPNDADGEANGVIKDPGAVVLPASAPPSSTTSPDASSSPGGAGALDWWWLMLLTSLLWLPYRLKQGQVND